MSDDTRLGDIESRLLRIEERMGLVQPPLPTEAVDTATTTGDKPTASPPLADPVSILEATSGPIPATAADKPTRPSAGIFLGFIGIACFLLAAVTLIRLSIDSGWLTPGRQLMIAFAFGIGLICFSFMRWFKDSVYMALLSGAGIVTLHLATYGGVFYHELISPPVGLGMVTAISVLALWLVSRLASDFMAVATVVGTYLGAILLGAHVGDLVLVGVFLIVWDIVYSTFSITLKNRRLLTYAAFFALLMVAVRGIDTRDDAELSGLAILQLIQLVIFVGGVVRYTIVHRTPLTPGEARALGPIMLFFYGTEYSFIDRLNPDLAPWCGIAFAAAVFAIYVYARNRLKAGELASREVALTTVSVALTHSVFFVLLGDDGRALAGFCMLLVAPILLQGMAGKDRARGGTAAIILVVAWGYVSTLSGINISPGFGLVLSAMFGLALLLMGAITSSLTGGSNKPSSQWGPILLAAHLQMLVFLHRIAQSSFDGSSGLVVSILWVLYALAILAWGWSRRDKILGQSALGVITLATAKVMVFDLGQAEGLGRVGGLIMLGLVIFTCGYLYRKICAWQSD